MMENAEAAELSGPVFHGQAGDLTESPVVPREHVDAPQKLGCCAMQPEGIRQLKPSRTATHPR
jgi:hypothetical protein